METDIFTNIKNQKTSIWPPPGINAIDILKTNYQVMVAEDLLTTPGFEIFYQEWILNTISENKKTIFIPFITLKNIPTHFTNETIQVLQHNECHDYASFFHQIKTKGIWLFLTENEKTANNVIKASKEMNIYLRVYKLDSKGKLTNFKFSTTKKQLQLKNKVSYIDAFELPNKISPIRKLIRSNQNILKKGDIVYTSDNQPIILESEFLSNPQSITYHTNIQELQAKIYQAPWLNISYFEDKARLMLEKKIQCNGICWPTDLLYNINGEFIGILVPKAEGYQLKQQLMSQQGLEKNFPNWNRKNLTHLAKVILDKIIYLQNRNILFGLINPSTIFVKDENHVYFTEMDTYQIEGYPILSYEKVMQAPELQDSNEVMKLYTKQQDNYGIALLLFMLLMPGKFPYNKGKQKNISDSIKNMDFAFRYGKQGEEHGAKEYFGSWRFAWSHLGNELKQAFYYTFQYGQDFSIPEKRKDAQFWKEKVEKLERELFNPYDNESLRIFPRTFKRFSGMKTIKCTKCGIDHPDFYYKYPQKRICNSCLGQPSETYFVCKSCNKSFYYDFGTLFKYEKLVETKNFSMPTHCPYCRSDRRKCISCGKFIPTYRINDTGICFNCAKIARERIIKKYSCKCGNIITLTQGQFDFYMKKFGNLPQRCEQCRKKERKEY